MATSPFGDGTFTLDPLLQFMQRVVAWSVADPPHSFVNVHAFGGDIPTPYRGGGRAFGGPSGALDAIGFVQWLNRINAEVFFCCAAVDTYDREHSQRYLRALRKGIQPLWYRSLVVDLDVKPGRYASQRDALAAWLRFCRKVGLETGPLVSTGTGVHGYIAFDQPIPAAQRNNLARRLVAAAQAHDIKADWGVTTDAVRILRMPTSTNRKDKNNLAPCRVLELGSTMPVEAVAAALENYSPTPPTPGRARNGHDFSHLGPPPSNMPPVDPREADRAAADRDRSRETTTVELVAQHCPLVAASLARGGAGDHEPLWYTHAKLCHYLQDGREAFHRLSDHHAEYDNDQTDEKFDGVEALGWPLCRTFEETGPEAQVICAGCRHRGEGKSPIHFGVGLTAETRAPPTIDSDVPIIFRTEKVHRDEKGYIVSNEDGRRVFNVPVFNVDVMYDSEGNAILRIEFDKRTEDCSRSYVDIPPGIIGNDKEFRKVTGNRLLTTSHPKLAMEICMDWITQIQQSRQAYARMRNGWVQSEAGKITGFAAVGHTFDKDGAHRVPGQPPDLPVGNLDDWKKAVSGLVGKGHTEIEILIATAFAAPLVTFTMVDGLVVHARSSGSGKGKSAGIEVAQSVWAKRKARVQNTTMHSINQKMTDLNNLPLYVDEMITERDRNGERNFAKLILDASSGSGRDRLYQYGKSQPRAECCTIMVSAANVSLIQTANGRDTNAQAARVFEIPMPDFMQSATPEEVAVSKQLLDRNFGVVALPFCTLLGTKHEGINALILDVMKEMRDEIGDYQPDERYWLAAVVTILVGAKLAKALGLVDFDIAAMKRRLIQIYREQRITVKDMNVNADDPATQLARIGQFLNEKIRNRLITKHMPKQGRAGTGLLMNSHNLIGINDFVARYGKEDNQLWVSEAKLRGWCNLPANSGVNYETMKSVLIKAGYCTRNSKNPRRLGTGCNDEFVGAKEVMLEFDLNLPCNEPLRLTEGDSDAV